MAILASQILNLALLLFGTEPPEPRPPGEPVQCVGNITLPWYYRNGAVFQADKRIQVWGFTSTNSCAVFVTQVCGKYQDKVSFMATRDFENSPFQGNYIWRLSLPSTKSGENCVLHVKQGSSKKQLNIVYGDVIVCSGQSNMEFRMQTVLNASSEIQASRNYTNIRMFKVPHAYSPVPMEDLYHGGDEMWFKPDDQWRLSQFSAICFLYAR